MDYIYINSPDVLTPEEARLVLKIGKNQMYRLLKENRIKHFKVGSSIRIPKICLEQYITAIMEEEHVNQNS